MFYEFRSFENIRFSLTILGGYLLGNLDLLLGIFVGDQYNSMNTELLFQLFQDSMDIFSSLLLGLSNCLLVRYIFYKIGKNTNRSLTSSGGPSSFHRSARTASFAFSSSDRELIFSVRQSAHFPIFCCGVKPVWRSTASWISA